MMGKGKAPAIGTRRKLKRTWPFYLMVLPGLVYLLINNYMPMFGIVIAFKDMN